jgi:hypothetical protein
LHLAAGQEDVVPLELQLPVSTQVSFAFEEHHAFSRYALHPSYSAKALCTEKISKPKRKTKNIGRRNNNKENFLFTFTFITKRYKRKNINIKNKIPNKNILISKY